MWHKYHSWYFKIDSNFTRLTAREITYNNFWISLVVFMPNITTDHAITYTNRLNIFPAEILQKMSKYPPKFSKYLEKSRIFVLKISRFWIP